MTSLLRRLNPAITMAAACTALLALVAAAAGVGYAAGQIGTGQIKNNAITAAKIKKNAVTTKKVKNGSLKAKDLVALEKQKVPVFSNGGEGDCLWQSYEVVLPTTGGPTSRKDRDGRVILTGIAVATDAAGGDGDCNPSDPGQASDGIAFTLPASHIPAKSQYRVAGPSLIAIAGPAGFIAPGIALPPGAVWSPSGILLLDGIEFDAADSSVVVARTTPAKVKASGQWTGDLLKPLDGR